MGFGAIIASGERNELLRDELLDALIEVRVEQSLDEPTHFAIRFQEDICGDGPAIMKAPELQCEQIITIGVQDGDSIRCLVRGPITRSKCSAKLGGPGSFYEVHGQDRRVEIDRELKRRAWSGRASEVVQTILADHFDRAEVEKTRIVHGGQPVRGRPASPTLNQRVPDAAFVRQVARQNNFYFWIGYDCRLRSGGRSLEVEETANFRSSPRRPTDGPGGPVPLDQLALVPSVAVKLRVHVDKDQCQNVTAFDIDENPERPNRFVGAAVDDRDLRVPKTSATDPQPVVDGDGQRFGGSNSHRDVSLVAAGTLDDLQVKAESALSEAGWFVAATASTTSHMLGRVLIPHEVIEVEGLGKRYSGAYQVESVTHVINAAHHLMDIGLRRNAVGEA